MDDKIRSRLTKAIEAHVFPGCVVGIISGDQTWMITIGCSTYGQDALPLTEHAVYDVASITKAIPTSCIAMHFIDSRTLSLNEYIINFIPELSTNYREEIKIRHLLTHTLDFTNSLIIYSNFGSSPYTS
jgi:CubicO group peptidase (beta-lactamase class C family)